MEMVINKLKQLKENELYQIGLTPRTDSFESQEEHDKYHKDRALEYEKAISLLEYISEWVQTDNEHYILIGNIHDQTNEE